MTYFLDTLTMSLNSGVVMLSFFVRNSISSVNLDEEIANMVEFQKAYQAAAKFMTTVDGMMDSVIRM